MVIGRLQRGKKPVVLGRLQKILYILQPNDLYNCDSSSHFSVNTIDASVHKKNKSSFASYSFVYVTLSTSVLFVDHEWYLRLGHTPFDNMKYISFLSNKFPKRQSFICSICPRARQQRLPFPESSIDSTAPFQLIHVYLWGSYPTQIYNSFKYFLTIVDDFTRATWTHLLSSKANTFVVLKSFIIMINT